MSPDALVDVAGLGANGAAGPREPPRGWTSAPLAEITIPASNVDPRKGGRVFTYIDLSAVDGGFVRNAQTIEAERAPSRAKQLVQVGDTLFSGVRIYLKNIASVDIEHDGAIASTAFCVLRPGGAVDPRYLYYFVNWQSFTNRLLPLQRGNSPPAVLESDIKAQAIPLPPLVEQRRIVARIDGMCAEIAEGEAALERARHGLDSWRRALLKAAVTGELTRDWRAANPRTETGADLLARIRAERAASATRSSRGGRATAPEPVDTSALPELPEGWVWARLGDLGEVTGGLTKNPDREGFPDKLPFLRVANVQMGRLDLAELKEIGIQAGERNRLLLSPNDLLVVEGNGSVEQIGRCAIWNGEIQPCVHQNHIIKVRFSEPSLSAWALRWLLSPSGRAEIRKVASSTSGLHTLSISKIQNLPIPVPTIKEAAVAMGLVHEGLAGISDAEDQLRALLLDQTALRQSILKAAFEGRLVPQDPADEPASALLARLRGGDAVAGVVPRRRRQAPGGAQGALAL